MDWTACEEEGGMLWWRIATCPRVRILRMAGARPGAYPRRAPSVLVLIDVAWVACGAPPRTCGSGPKNVHDALFWHHQRG